MVQGDLVHRASIQSWVPITWLGDFNGIAGYGYNASNYFETTSDKVQAAAGFEFIVVDGVGLKLFGEYNYSFSDELDGIIAGESDDTFFRMGFGINLYFGGNKRKQRLWSKIDTVIKSNLVK